MPASGMPHPRPWDLALRAFVEYDSNVPLASDNSDFEGSERSPAAGVSVSGVYRIVQESPWEVGVGGSITQTGYLESDVDDFAYTSISPNIYASYEIDGAPIPMTGIVAYSMRQDLLQFDSFLNSNNFTFTLEFIPAPRTVSSVYYGLTFDNFASEGPDPDVTSRDAVVHTFGADTTFYFPETQQSLTVAANYRRNDADGDNFVFNSWGLGAEFFTPISGPVTGSVAIGYSSDDYTKFTTDPERTQDNVNVRGTVFFAISNELVADVYLSYLQMNGSSDDFDATRTTIGAGITYRP